MQDVAAANGVARHHRHHRFRAGTDLPLEVEHVKMVHARVILIAAVVAAHLLVTPGAEGLLTFAGEDNYPNRIIVAGIRQRLEHLFYRQGTKRIAHLRTVDGDFGDAVRRFLVANVAVAFRAVLPLNRRVKHGFIGIDHQSSLISSAKCAPDRQPSRWDSPGGHCARRR